ncbi:hypothetical protein [Roseobacter sinensis]|uniref:Glucosyl transferase GtrII n=1 Tax=Roseobacter sinensis TaxID=2931391 RepID=A0ABT3BDR6_9RHOB|nr:hypothetical protein [Roseobacter sp. WL0113]MCV3271539.1 hypothetical protein [Roseobacter sp. WL0113]
MTEAPTRMPLRIPPVFWLALGVIALISLPNLRDPMIRHDDFPALLGHADAFWNKTLHEGRWLNYVWHLRDMITPAWLNFALYQICWAIFATALAVAATRQDKSVPAAALMAALILVAPPATLISLWFNTLLPGLALVALYGVIVCCSPQPTARRLLPVFIVATFMAYTTYPLLLLALCLAATQRRSLRDLFGLLSLFSASFIGAVLITYALNWQVHGIFGVPLAEWREAEPAESIAGLWANLSWVQTSFARFFEKAMLGSIPLLLVHGGCLLGAALVMIRRAPMELVYFATGLLTGLALVVVQAAKLGVLVPPRAMIFLWVFYAAILVRGAQLLSQDQTPLSRLGVVAAAILTLAYGAVTHQRYAGFQQWQTQTRSIGLALANLPGPVHVVGRATQSAAGQSAGIQSDQALAYRLEQFSGHRIVLCQPTGIDCGDLPPHTSAGWQVLRTGDTTRVIVPDDGAERPR